MLITEQAAYRAQFRTFDEALIAHIEKKDPHDTIAVVFWLKEPLTTSILSVSLDINRLLGSSYHFTINHNPPLLSVQMSKQHLLRLQWYDALDRIYVDTRFKIAEPVVASSHYAATPTVLSALHTQYIYPLHDQNYQGQNQIIGIVETKKVRSISSLNVLAYQASCATEPFGDHATFVANIAAGNSVLGGVAPQASLLSACSIAAGHLQTSLDWIFDQGAHVANISLSDEGSNQLTLSDRLVDYVARTRNKLVVVSAGNNAGYVGSPSKAYNVLSVGAFLDTNTVPWRDDRMWWDTATRGSAFRNPQSSANDREKPEVVAVGNITTLVDENTPASDTGTSLSAPQVAGLATLLLNMNANLSQWPEVTKAIIMAASAHNIEGDAFIPSIHETDYRDGAGALIGTLARDMALNQGTQGNWFPCTYSCWWGISASNTELPVGATTGGRIWADPGQRVRIVVSWWANATPAFHYGLETDFDLVIRGPNDSIVALSKSTDNNYEMVDFLAPQQGLYRIEVKKFAANETGNKLGIAALVYDQTPFLPYKIFLPYSRK
ncbi:S8 family serine peptidase [Herpetosiphon sp. NSE202]|uniref:S8 family serine peptidase n=1 Tax=Herpetosiphon sp. NSE202 TaxID=3351349 RepID=UPI003642DE9D